MSAPLSPDPAEVLALAFTAGATVEPDLDAPGEPPWTLRVEEVGQLHLQDGTVTAGDPFTGGLSNPPLDRSPGPGPWPVDVAFARLAPDHERVVAARLRFADGPVARVVPALWGPGGVSGEEAAVGVDAGTAAFACAARGPGLDTEADGEALLAAFDAEDHAACQARPHPRGPDAAVCFSSGWGDGIYGLWWALGEEGQLISLFIDFDLLHRPVWATEDLPMPPPRGPIRTRLEPPVRLWRPWLGGWPGFGADRLCAAGGNTPGFWRVSPNGTTRISIQGWTAGAANFPLPAGPFGPDERLRVGVVTGHRLAARLG